MQVNVSSRHMDVTEPLRNYAEQKASKLSKYYDRIHDVEVVLDAGKDGTRVEMIVIAEHKNRFVAHHDQGDAYAGIDGCMEKLERQLSEHKKKFRNRKHPNGDTLSIRQPGAAIDASDETEPTGIDPGSEQAH